MQDQDPKDQLHSSHSSKPPGHNDQYDVSHHDALSPPSFPAEQYAIAPALPEIPSRPSRSPSGEKIYEGPGAEGARLPYSPATSLPYPSSPPATDGPRPWFDQTVPRSEHALPSSPEQGHLWVRNPGLFWLAVGIAALLLIAIPVSIFQVYSYLNRPTPAKTLDTFCSALVQENYPLAYEQFSPNLQLRLPRSRFIVLLAQDRVVSCTHGNADENSQSPRANLKLVHNSQGINSDMVLLKKGSDNQWKIEDVEQAR